MTSRAAVRTGSRRTRRPARRARRRPGRPRTWRGAPRATRGRGQGTACAFFLSGSWCCWREPAASAVVDPPGVLFDGSIDALATFAMQNPLIARYAQTGDPRALKFSDFLTRRELHRLDIYNELYRPTGVEHQMAFALPAGRGLV